MCLQWNRCKKMRTKVFDWQSRGLSLLCTNVPKNKKNKIKNSWPLQTGETFLKQLKKQTKDHVYQKKKKPATNNKMWTELWRNAYGFKKATACRFVRASDQWLHTDRSFSLTKGSVCSCRQHQEVGLDSGSGSLSGWSSSFTRQHFMSTKPAPRLQILVWRWSLSPPSHRERWLYLGMFLECNFIYCFFYFIFLF